MIGTVAARLEVSGLSTRRTTTSTHLVATADEIVPPSRIEDARMLGHAVAVTI